MGEGVHGYRGSTPPPSQPASQHEPPPPAPPRVALRRPMPANTNPYFNLTEEEAIELTRAEEDP